MSLRTRLVLAFFTLSVVPLAAVTVYSYTANVNALREAAEREADLLAGELGQRMQLVTAQLSERVEHLMDIAELQSAAEQAEANAEALKAAAAAPVPVSTSTSTYTAADPGRTLVGPVTGTHTTLTDSIAKSLGEAAMLLNNVELQNMRSFGGSGRGGGTGRGVPPPGTPPPATSPRSGGGGANRGAPPAPGVPPPSAAASVTTAGAATAGATTPAVPPDQRVRGSRDSRQNQGGRPAQHPDRTGQYGQAATVQGGQPAAPAQAAGNAPQTAGAPNVPAPPGAPPSLWTTVDASGKVKIDMAPIRREMFRQILPEGRMENLTAEERQRVAAEVNQRMLGIQQGIKLSAAELARQAQQAEKAAEKAATAQKVAVKTGASTDLKRRATLSGSHIDVKVERDGQVVRQMNAEINLPNVLATVFTTTRSDRGEMPFAVAKDGTIYARSEADKARVAALGDVAKPGGPATARMRDWIVVTTEDKSGSGLRLGIARPVTDSLSALRLTTARNAGLGLLFIVIALAGIVPLSSGLTRNLSRLSEAVARIAKGDYRARVPVRARAKNDEVGRLALAFNSMAADVERHQRTAVEQERIRRELELGRQIQNDMLPRAPLHLGLTEVQGVSVPAREVGGDFFNYFVLANGDIALLMGDVSGKGVGAALLMANIQAALKARLGLGQDLSAVADALDRDIDANSPGPVYATLFMAILEPSTRRLRYVNAGHNPQFVLLKQGLHKMPATGLPVGLLSGRGYSEQSVQLSAGDFLFLYTDGCVEAENEQGEFFGMERLEQLLTASERSRDPLRHVEAGVAEFRGRSEPSDDATMMTVRVG